MVKVLVGMGKGFEEPMLADDGSDGGGSEAFNAFHVNRSFLIENSCYFAALLDDTSPPRRDTILLQADFEIFADWLDVLYQGDAAAGGILTTKVVRSEGRNKGEGSVVGSASKRDYEHGYKELLWAQKYSRFADLVGSPRFKNAVVDSMQEKSIHKYNLASLRSLELMDDHSVDGTASRYVDYVLECVAYQIVTQGWGQFILTEVEKKQWAGFITDEWNVEIFHRLLLKVDEVNRAKDQNELISPTARRDCKWHQHTDKDRKQCARYRPERNPVGTLFH
jgi:hypothetical protein